MSFLKLKKYTGYYLVLPTLIIIALIAFFPIEELVRLSFTNLNLLNPTSKYIGFGNYQKLLMDASFWNAFFHSVVLTSVVVFLQLTLGTFLALLLNMKMPAMGFFKSTAMLSWVMPIVATVIMFQFMSEPKYGLINIILSDIGLGKYATYWFGSMTFAFPSIILMHLWRNVPFYGIALLAAMQSIPKSLYEAASIDGANAFRKFWHVTVPGIKYMAVIMMTIHIAWTFNQFSIVYLATNGGPVSTTMVLPVYIYDKVWSSYSVGYGSAVGVIMLIILSVVFMIFSRAFRQEA